MAMRPRTSGGSNSTGNRQPASAVEPVYEDFKPTSEWIQDQETAILLIYLLGFTKENLKVSTEGRNIIRVRGERLITGNKWQRFQEDYQAPDDCNLRGARARFEGGILTITVPKIPVPKNTKKESKSTSSAVTSQKTPEIPPAKGPVAQKVLEAIPPKITALKQEDKAKAFPESSVSPKPFSTVPPKVAKEPVTQKVQENIPPIVATFQNTTVSSNPFSTVPPKSFSPYSDDKREDDQTFSKREKLPKESDVEQKQKDESGASRHQETLTERKAEQGHDEMDKDLRKSMLMAGRRRKRIEKQMQETEIIEAQKTGLVDEDKAEFPKKTKTSSGTGHFELRNYKNALKSISELDEERKLLVNMGASVLVIMALGAYIYHTVKN